MFSKLISLLALTPSSSSSLFPKNTLYSVPNHRFLEEDEDGGGGLVNLTKNGPLDGKLAYHASIYNKGVFPSPDGSVDLGNDLVVLNLPHTPPEPTNQPTIDPKAGPKSKPKPKAEPKSIPGSNEVSLESEINSKIPEEEEESLFENRRRDLSITPIKSPRTRRDDYYLRSNNLRGNNNKNNLDKLSFSSSFENLEFKLQEQTLINVEGIPVNGGAPSDSCGANGLTYYIQVVNDQYAIFNKATGTMLSGYPKPGYALYSSFNDGSAGSTACRTSTNGDPTVQYDKFADRWVFTEFAWTSANSNSGPYYQV